MADNAKEIQEEINTRIHEYKTLKNKQHALRQMNTDVPHLTSIRNDLASGKVKLKSDLKKSSAFVKKLKVYSDNSMPQLLKDVAELNLTRYLSEIIASITEAPLKLADVNGIVQVVSQLHQKYQEFSENLILALVNRIKQTFSSSASIPPKANSSKRRVLLRLLSDLYVVGVHDEIQQVVQILDLVFARGATPGKRAQAELQPLDIQLLVSFAKHSGYEFLGVQSRKMKQWLQVDESALDQAFGEIVPAASRSYLRSSFNSAYENISKMYLTEFQALKKREERNEKELVNRGEISEKNAAEYELAKQMFEKLSSCMVSLGDALHLDVPALPQEEKDAPEAASGLTLWGGEGREEFSADGPFEDEETRSFYQDLPDLLGMVPPVVLGFTEDEIAAIRKQQEAEKAEEEKDQSVNEEEELEEEEKDDAEENEAEEIVEDVESLETAVDEATVELNGEDTPSAGTPPTSNAFSQFDLYLEQLEHMVNRERCDNAATEFCYMNNKGTRKRLVQTLYGVPRTHLELLPYYSRFVAILNPVMQDIGKQLVDCLLSEFRYLQRKKNQYRLESKIRNIRYLAELTKFGIAPPVHGFKCLKKCFDDFQNHNIDIATAFLETCGRFLYRSKHTHVRLNSFLEIMMRLKSKKHFDNRSETLIQNAYYVCKPPEGTTRVVKEYSPLYLYMYHLLAVELATDNADKVLSLLRKFPWEDNPQVKDYLVKAVVKISVKGNYVQLSRALVVVRRLSKYQLNAVIHLIDTTIELIKFSLVLATDYRENQKQLGYCKLLSEMFLSGVINATLLFDCMYMILNDGHDVTSCAEYANLLTFEHTKMFQLVPEMKLDPRVPCAYDGEDHTFRLRLICVILDKCGKKFDKGITRMKLIRFVTFFQRYMFTKRDISLEIQFAIMDTLDRLAKEPTKPHASGVRKDSSQQNPIPRYGSWEEAEYASQCYLQQELEEARKSETFLAGISEEAETPRIYANEDEEDEDDELGGSEEENDIDEEDEVEGDEEEDESSEHNSSDDDEDNVILRDRVVTAEEDEEFEKAFKSMMQGSIESRKHIPRVNADNMALPTAIKVTTGSSASVAADEVDTPAQPNHQVVFRMLKRGNKGKVEARQLIVPEASSLAQHSQRQESAERQQHSELKRLVLQNVEREEFGVTPDDEIARPLNAPLARRRGWRNDNRSSRRDHQHGQLRTDQIPNCS